MRIMQEMSLMEKLNILSDAAKYDVACTSSGSNRRGDGKGIGNTVSAGICHSFSADGRCISLLKILFTNECIYDCKYCQNRRSNDVPRASFTPDEVCRLTIEFYRRNYIEGLFLSSGIIQNPNVTMGLLYQTIYKLRTQYHFQGYIHVKAIPGADPELIRLTGFLADPHEYQSGAPDGGGLIASCTEQASQDDPDADAADSERNFCEQTGGGVLPARPGIRSGWTVYADDYRRDTGA